MSYNHSAIEKEILSTITLAVAAMASKRRGASETAMANIECIAASTTPLMSSLFKDVGAQDRLLFTLVLAGACITAKLEHSDDSRDDFSFEICLSPETIQEAFRVYQLITGRDIKPYLPAPMIEFAMSEQPTLN